MFSKSKSRAGFDAGHKRRAGFTLIELLVVLGLVAVLMSLIMPAFSKARAVVARTLCLSIERAIMQSVGVYAADNKDYMPLGIALSPLDQTRLQFPECRQSRIAGNHIWGININDPGFGPGVNAGTAKLGPVGLGVLITERYSQLDAFWCPIDKRNWGADRYGDWSSNSWMRRKQLFGNTTIQQPWIDADGHPYSPWTTWNYCLQSSYVWRSADRTWWDPTTNTLQAGYAPGDQRLGPLYFQPAITDTLHKYMRMTAPTNNTRPLLVDGNKWELNFPDAVFHGNLGGANVAFGDGSAKIWNERELALGYYTSAPSYLSAGIWTDGTVQDPVTKNSGGQWFSIWGSCIFARADFYFRGDLRGR